MDLAFFPSDIILESWFEEDSKLRRFFSRFTEVNKGSFIEYIRKIFRKTNISYPLVHKRTAAYQGVRDVSFSEFGKICVRIRRIVDIKKPSNIHIG